MSERVEMIRLALLGKLTEMSAEEVSWVVWVQQQHFKEIGRDGNGLGIAYGCNPIIMGEQIIPGIEVGRVYEDDDSVSPASIERWAVSIFERLEHAIELQGFTREAARIITRGKP